MKIRNSPAHSVLFWLFLQSWCVFAQEDDFSLGSDFDYESDKNSVMPDDDNGEKSNLFGDMPTNPLPEDTKSTIVKSVKPTEPLVPTKPQSMTLPAPGGLPSDVPISSSTGSKPILETSKSPPASTPSAPKNTDVSTPQSNPPATLPLIGDAPTNLGSPPSDISTFQPANTNAVPPVVAVPSQQESVTGEAPLTGDGTMAPVKNYQAIKPNDFGGVPPLPGTRRELAPGEAPEMYSVEEGDTMFDVCSQLIDDGNYWPKLWSLNPDVKNPHFIYPQMKLAFYSGDQETPPYLEVVTDDDVLPIDKGSLTEAELVSDNLIVDGNDGRSETVVTAQELESPIPVVGPTEIGADSDGLDGFIFAGRIFSSDTRELMVPAFFFANQKEPLGVVVGGINGESLCGDDQRVLLSADESIAMGTYTILRPVGSVSSLRTGDGLGYRYDFSGHVKLLKQTKTGLYEAKIFGARGGVREGDIIVNFISTRRSVSASSAIGSIGTAQSSVIGFEDAGKTSGGLGDLVFVEKTGLSAGMSYGIYRMESYRDVRHSRNEDAAMSGTLAAIVKIIEINGEAALGQIINGQGDVRIGDTLSL